MQLRTHRHRSSRTIPATALPAPAAPEGAARGSRVFAVQRIGAVLVAVVIGIFGILGFADGLAFFSTEGGAVLGMSSNGLLSTISVVTAALLLSAAAAGPRPASTVMLVVGVLFLLSGLGNLALLRTGLNLLAFEMANVVFSVVAGLFLVVLGAYGRISGNLPLDSPYAHAGEPVIVVDERPATPEEAAAEQEMRTAEVAMVNHTASPDQARRVAAMAQVHSRADRRRVWVDSAGRRPV